MYSRQGVKRKAWAMTKARGPGCLPAWLGWVIVIALIVACVLINWLG